MTPGKNRAILVVEDDDDFRCNLADQLRLHASYDVGEAADGKSALALAGTEIFDAILLDIRLPDMDGRDVCRVMRRKGIHAPGIMLTALDGDSDTILGLDSGANDYVAKPFRMGVLLARIRTHIRQHEMSEDATFVVGPYLYRPAAKRLQGDRGNQDIALSDKENAILKHLYRAAGSAVTSETLYAEIWDYSASLATHTLQTHIYRLRQKIERDPSRPEILLSETGGYRLVR